MCKRRVVRAALVSLSFLLLSASGAWGADRDVCPSGCAYPSIYEAVSAAETGDVVRVAAGLYYETREIELQDPISLIIQGGWNASFTSRSPNPSLTVVDMLSSSRFLYVYAYNGETIDVTVEGLTLTGGLTTGSGGAVYVQAGSGSSATADTTVRVTMRGNRLVGNQAGYSGGAVSAYASADSDTFRAVLDLTVANNEIIANSAMSTGGAIYLYGDSYPSPGKAVLRYTVEGNTIHGNTAVNTSALYVENSRSPCEEAGVASSISRNDISGNTAFDEQAVQVYMYSAGPSTLNIRNNRICNNAVRGSDGGGGIYLNSSETSAVVNLVNNTIAGNGGYGLRGRSRAEAGVPDNFVLNLYNNIFHRNQPTSSAEEVYLYNSSDGNMVANAGSNLFTGGLSGAVDVSDITFNDLGGNIIGDALLGDDFYPAASSQAINNADAAQAPATDMTGAARVGAPDIGALEFSGTEHRAMLPAPLEPVEVRHVKSALPTVSSDPFVARPFACGNVDSGTVSLRIALPAFSAPVDVYAGISVPWGPDLYMITPAGGLELLSDSLIKWRSGQTAAVDQSFFGSLDANLLPRGRYGLHLFVVPAGKLAMGHYLYESEMVIR